MIGCIPPKNRILSAINDSHFSVHTSVKNTEIVQSSKGSDIFFKVIASGISRFSNINKTQILLAGCSDYVVCDRNHLQGHSDTLQGRERFVLDTIMRINVFIRGENDLLILYESVNRINSPVIGGSD